MSDSQNALVLRKDELKTPGSIMVLLNPITSSSRSQNVLAKFNSLVLEVSQPKCISFRKDEIKAPGSILVLLRPLPSNSRYEGFIFGMKGVSTPENAKICELSHIFKT